MSKNGQFVNTMSYFSNIIYSLNAYSLFLSLSLSLSLSPATPADVGLLMQLGVDGVFVGSGIFKSSEPEKRARAMVQAVTNFNNPQILATVSAGLGEAMVSPTSSEITLLQISSMSSLTIFVHN